MRQSIEIPGLSHLAPIPVATRIGPLLVTSVISPYSPGTRDVPTGISDQVRNLFAHMDAVLQSAGYSWPDVAKVNVFSTQLSLLLPILNEQWVAVFPDKKSRPSRHCQPMPDAGDGISILCDFLAYRTASE